MQYTKIKPFVLFAGFMAFILAFLLLMPVSAMADDTDVPRETINIPENGEIEFELKAGQTITFYNLPAGTSYQVWEETPDGWVIQGQTNSAGKIISMETQECEFVNKYEPGVATATLHGSKIFNYAAADEEAFEFILEENGDVLQRIKNTAGGAIQFNRIEYEEPGEHTYLIYEDVSYIGQKITDAGYEITDINWDIHKETVQVNVTKDNDGVMHVETVYDDDGMLFNNGLKKGVLEIQKQIINGTIAAALNEFNIKISLTNPNGTMSTGTYYYYVSEDESDTKTITLLLGDENLMFYPEGEQIALTKYVDEGKEKIALKFKEWPSETDTQAFMNPKTAQYDLSFNDIWRSDRFGIKTEDYRTPSVQVMENSNNVLFDVYEWDKNEDTRTLLLQDQTCSNVKEIMSSIGASESKEFIVTIRPVA